ncbi:MAG: metallophosphoesterase family protein [Fimbriimonas sp.]|nr:metallophosphoesterase family protein [Fimbriimonas sp.]
MIYAVGDIHGQLEKLRTLLTILRTAGMTDADTLVFLGDYVDRGPDTAGVIGHLIEMRERRPNTVFLRGNHEQMLLDARQRYDCEFDARNPVGNCESGRYWHAEGGVQTLKSYGPRNDRHWTEMIPESHWDFMLDTSLEFEEGVYRFVHAGVVPPGEDWHFGEFDADPRLWIRTLFHVSDSEFDGKTIVFGHTPTADERPILMWNKIGIDTGAGYGGPLTAVGLPDPYDLRFVKIYQAR